MHDTKKAGFGQLQLNTMSRDIGVKHGLGINHQVFDWGVNLSAVSCNNDSKQSTEVYGGDVSGMGNNKGLLNSDTAFTRDGRLEVNDHGLGRFGTSIASVTSKISIGNS